MVLLLDAGRSSLLATSPSSSSGPSFASKRATFPPKNRVWGFEANPLGRFIGRSLPRPKTTTGYRRDSYKIASGRPQWLSRDPLPNAEQIEGMNLYEYVSDRPLVALDPLGLGSRGFTPTKCPCGQHLEWYYDWDAALDNAYNANGGRAGLFTPLLYRVPYLGAFLGGYQFFIAFGSAGSGIKQHCVPN